MQIHLESINGLKTLSKYTIESILEKDFFIEQIISSLLTPVPFSEGHYLKSTKAEVRGSILQAVGWFDKMTSDAIKFNEKGKKHGLEF